MNFIFGFICPFSLPIDNTYYFSPREIKILERFTSKLEWEELVLGCYELPLQGSFQIHEGQGISQNTPENQNQQAVYIYIERERFTLSNWLTWL